MNRREAKRRVCEGALHILNSAADQDWLRGGPGESLSAADGTRMQQAFRDLLEELARRAGVEAYTEAWWWEASDE